MFFIILSISLMYMNVPSLTDVALLLCKVFSLSHMQIQTITIPRHVMEHAYAPALLRLGSSPGISLLASGLTL